MRSKKTISIAGAGQAIAYRFASGQANIVIASKDNPSHIKETMDGISKAKNDAGRNLFHSLRLCKKKIDNS